MTSTVLWTFITVTLLWASSPTGAEAEAVEKVVGWRPMPTFSQEAEQLMYQTHRVELQFNNTPLTDIDITDGETMTITFFLDDPLPLGMEELVLQELSQDEFGHIIISPNRWHVGDPNFVRTLDGQWAGSFNLTGTFLGFSEIIFLLKDGDGENLAATPAYDVRIQRSDKLWDFLFTVGMIILVAIAYINMGCAIDLEVIKRVLKRPVAPLIGLSSQYLFMPITSYLLGYALFYDYPPQWLGLFLIGSSPGGGGSNIWTYLLGGSLDLSVTMTLISTIVAFAALPIWVYALATTIFRDGNFSKLPYDQMAGMVVSLILPCALGVIIKKYHPKVADFLKRMLTPVAILFVIFATTVGVYVNLYIFSFFTWKVIVAGIALPWLGFMFGMVISILLKRSWEEIIAISVETGIQNTGLAIGVIKFAMQKYSPLGDITVVIPIAVAMFTPLPLIAFLIMKKVQQYLNKEEDTKEKQISGAEETMQDLEQQGRGVATTNSHKMVPATSQTPLHKDPK